VRHIPANSPFDVLDTRFAGRVGDNRWNRAGDPILYIASDKGVALAEFARHFRDRQDPALGPMAIERAMYELQVRVALLLDLRQAGARAALGLHGGPRRFLDAEVARATSTFIRRTTEAEALLARWDQHWASHGFGYWVIRRHGEQTQLGFCGLKMMSLADERVLNLFPHAHTTAISLYFGWIPVLGISGSL